MGFYVVDHVAHLARFDVAAEAAQKLIGAPRRLVDHEALAEAHVAGIWAKPVPDATFDYALLERTLHRISILVSLRLCCSHRKAYISWLSLRGATIWHQEKVLMHRCDRCLLQGRKDRLRERRLHHRRGKAIEKGTRSRLLEVVLLLLSSCCLNESTILHHFILHRA